MGPPVYLIGKRWALREGTGVNACERPEPRCPAGRGRENQPASGACPRHTGCGPLGRCRLPWLLNLLFVTIFM